MFDWIFGLICHDIFLVKQTGFIIEISMLMCKQTQPLLSMPPGGLTMAVSSHRWLKEKVAVVMGATGTGKSRLSIDPATRFPAEIVNSDKMKSTKD